MGYPRKQLEGREHVVVPVVMALEGVLHGSQGAFLYPADELRRSVPHWNGRPVVVYHPDMANGGVANQPDVYNRQRVGTLFNARFDGRALKAEAWLEVDRLRAVDMRVLEAVNKAKMMEVSTGLFTENDDTPGVFNGREYTAIARNYRPDHLAILPDKVGACSIEDGAGLCRNDLVPEPLVPAAVL